MRTLNRPMFNMGGPIKQGVMHGIREPYRYGNRVGFDNGGWANYFKNIFKKSAPVVKQVVGKKVKPIVGGINQQKWLEHLHKTMPKVKQTVSGLTSSPAAQSFIKNLKDFSFPGSTKALGYAKKGLTYINPLRKPKTSIAGGIALTSDPAREAYKNIKPIGKWMAEAALPGWAERKFLPWKTKTEDLIDPPLSPNIQKKIAEKPSAVDLLLAGAGKDNEKYALAERNKRVQKYLDLMGYDRAKKTAIGDALIDASKIVGDRGTLDLKNISRELINPIIQATSKRLDKPGQIREAVGLMMTKADLEKEMYDAKPGTVLKNVQDMIKSGIPKDEAWAIATKGSKGTLADIQGAMSTGKVTATNWPSFLRTTGEMHGDDVTVVTAKDIKDNEKLQGKSTLEIVTEFQKGPGFYMIDQDIFQVDGNKNITQVK